MKVILALFITMHLLAITMFAEDSIISTSNSDKALELIIKADSTALADSMNKVFLQTQLEDLRNTERTRRRKIEKELNLLKEKDSLRQVKLEHEIIRLKNDAIGYPIVPHKDTLFFVYTKIGSLTPAERAKVITERLHKLYREFFIKTDSLTLVNTGQSMDIFFKGTIILSITELDQLWYEKPKVDIANEFITAIENDIIRFKKDRSITKVAKESGFVLLIVISLFILIKGINYIFRAKINKFLWSKRGVWFKGIKFRNSEIIDANRETSLILSILKLVRYALIILLFYIALPLIFSIFPVTQRLADTLFEYILSPVKNIGLAFVDYIPKLITVIVIIIITRLVLRVVRFVANEIEKENFVLPGFYADWAKPTYNILKVFILAFMVVVLWPYLPGSDSKTFKGVSVFLGIVFSLGSTSVIGNLIAGLVITYMRPFKIGDRIKIGEVIGNVIEKTPFVIRVRSPKKENITIPNSNILASNVINYSNSKLQGGLIIHTTVTIGYDVPWRKVHQALMNAAKKTDHLNMDIAPFVLQTSLDDFYVSYQVNAHTNEPDKVPAIYSELHENIQDEFNEEGIEILSPHYRAARDGNKTTIPNDCLP